MIMNLIELKGISLHYELQGHELSVLKGVDLIIKKGEMVAILGPSGSGKSTLLYILGCLLKPSSGEYILDGASTGSYSEAELADLRAKKIGFVFQQFHLLPRANIIENLLLSGRYFYREQGIPEEFRAKALGLLKRVGLSEHLSHKPNELSGGQQQRVAIARALMNDPELILADEPTGNLDSKSASQILDLLRDIQMTGRSVIIITHDQDVAKRCDRIIKVHDGSILSSVTAARSAEGRCDKNSLRPPTQAARIEPDSRHGAKIQWREDLLAAWQNLLRNKSRSLLTMLGVMIGVAAVLVTLTLGSYTEKKILQSYESLGVNRLVVRAYPRWNMAAKDLKGAKFEGINQQSDLVPLRKIFPEIELVSPVVQDWIKSVEFAGKSYDQAKLLGANEEYFSITNRRFVLGHAFSRYHVTNRSRVCVIGYDVATRLFASGSPLGQILQINGDNETQYSCQVIGVLASQTSNNEWFNPNQQILLPDTFLSLMANKWNSKPFELNLRIKSGASLEDLALKIKQFFFLKYGRSAQVRVDSDGLLVAQMRHFLTLFTMLLTGVALISLGVGGIGIANMMLVSVAERFKEIGLRKALGARDIDIRRQFLVESTLLCAVAGIVGLISGFVGYHLILYLASRLFKQITFEWIYNYYAMALSLICIFAVGLLSGLVPALRAEKLQVVEALRSE